MNNRLSILLLALLVACQPVRQRGDEKPHNPGQRIPVTFADLQKGFANPDMIYAPFVFWFWDEPLNPDKMAEMARTMGAEGFNPGYAHARHSMVGTPSLPDSQWLGDRWFRSFGDALAEAEKRNEYLGYCDEYWWPSFQAHGRVLKEHPELKAQSLNWTLIDAKGGSSVKVPSSYFAVAAQLTSPVEIRLPQPKLGSWIWHPDAKEVEHTCWMRCEFDIPADRTVKEARIRITCDNGFVLFVNGKKTGEGSDWEKPQLIDVRDLLVPGRNLLAVEASNIDGKYGLISGMTITLDDGTIMNIHSGPGWTASLVRQIGWETPSFHPAGWKPVAELGKPGDGPWNSINDQEPYVPALILSKTLKVIGSGEPFEWKVPEGPMWRIYVFNQYFHPGAADGEQSNVIDTRLAPAFAKIALEPYAEHFPGQMGKSIPGDFIDHEGDYGWQLAWSGSLDSAWTRRLNGDIRQLMPLMLDRDSEGKFASMRWNWFDLVSDLYSGNFRTITNWHETRGMYTTAHVWEEGIQPEVNCVGDHLKLLRSLTMPGQDCLGLKALRVHDFKEPQSVSEFGNVRFASEVLGASDFEPGMGPWGCFTPTLLKESANGFTTWGVSHVITHGVFATRQLKNNPWPPDWYSENPMFPWMHHWTDFVRRASYINSMGHTVPDVLLYNPMESAWMNANAPLLDVNGMWSFDESIPNGKEINRIDKVYSEAINDLTEARIEFLVGDRYYLGLMKAKKGRLVTDDFSFSTLVLPKIEILPLAVAKKILDLARSGGYVYSLDELPSASAENGMNDPEMIRIMASLQKLPTYRKYSGSLKQAIVGSAPGLSSPIRFAGGAFPMLQQHRRIDGRDFFWLANNSDTARSCELMIPGIHGAASIWDCETGNIRPVNSANGKEGATLSLEFRPLGAFWLVFDPGMPVNTVPELPAPEILTTVTGNWTVTCDTAIQPVMEFPLIPPVKILNGMAKPLEDWSQWGLGRFSGLLDYNKTIEIPDPEAVKFIDLGKVCHSAEVWINGKPAGSKLWGPFVFDISNLLKKGHNDIHVRVANLINNSYGDPKESGLMGPVKLMGE